MNECPPPDTHTHTRHFLRPMYPHTPLCFCAKFVSCVVCSLLVASPTTTPPRNTSPIYTPNTYTYIQLSRFQIWLQAKGGGTNDAWADGSIPAGAGGKAKGCGTFALSTTNSRPTVTVPATCSIPRKTPYVLTGSAVDPDGTTDTLTFSWEQIDAASKQVGLDYESPDGPLVISAFPTPEGSTRYIPPLAGMNRRNAGAAADPLNRLSSRKRTLHFALTARDHFNGPGGGTLDKTWGTWDAKTLAVGVSALGPLTITAPSASATKIATGSSTISWQLPGAKTAAGTADDKALLAADYAVTYTVCDVTNCDLKIPLWLPLASRVKLSAKGRGSATVFLPRSVQGKTILVAVTGQVVGSRSMLGQCSFWQVSKPLTVETGTTTATLASSSPAGGATDVSLGLKTLSLTFNAPVFVVPGKTTAVTVAEGSGGSTSTSFGAASLAATGAEVSFYLTQGASASMTPLKASTAYTVTLAADALCAAPVASGDACPTGAAVTGAPFQFNTAAAAAAPPAAPVLAAQPITIPHGAVMKGGVPLMDVDAADGKGATLEIVFDTSVFLTAQGGNITVNDMTWPEPKYVDSS